MDSPIHHSYIFHCEYDGITNSAVPDRTPKCGQTRQVVRITDVNNVEIVSITVSSR